MLFSDSDALKEFDEAAQAADPSRESVQDFWQTPSVNWQNTFDAKITSWLAINVFLQMIYQKYDPTTTLDSSLPIDAQIALVDGGIRKSPQ